MTENKRNNGDVITLWYSKLRGICALRPYSQISLLERLDGSDDIRQQIQFTTLFNQQNHLVFLGKEETCGHN